MTDTIAKFLGAEEPSIDDVEQATTELAVAHNNEMEKFTEVQDFVTSNIKNIIEQGMSNLQNVLQVMADSEDPKMYNATAAYIKTLVDTNKTLYDVNKPLTGKLASGGSSKDNPQQAIQINNSEVTLVSSADLLDD